MEYALIPLPPIKTRFVCAKHEQNAVEANLALFFISPLTEDAIPTIFDKLGEDDPN